MKIQLLLLINVIFVINLIQAQKLSSVTISAFSIENLNSIKDVSIVGTAGEMFVGTKNNSGKNYFEGFLSLSDIFLDDRVNLILNTKVIPNPIRSNFFILADYAISRITLVGLTGITIHEMNVENSNNYILPETILPGIYILKIYNENYQVIDMQKVTKF